MSAFCINKLLTSSARVLIIATAIAWGETAEASNFQANSMGKSWHSGNSLLAQVGQPSPTSDTHPVFPNSDFPSPSPARVPEPAMLAGLGIVAGSFALTRRRPGKKEV